MNTLTDNKMTAFKSGLVTGVVIAIVVFAILLELWK